MPYVACPSCGERGRIGLNLIGARIKCKKCGTSFVVSPPDSADAEITEALGEKKAVVSYEGIEVEGLEPHAWTAAPEAAMTVLSPPPTPAAPAARPPSPAVAMGAPAFGSKQYKLLTTKDKFFDGKFDLARLEEALNHFARDGWVVKGIATPQIKGFTGVFAEELVVLLER